MRKYIYTRFEKRNVKLVYGTPAVFVIEYPKERQTAKKSAAYTAAYPFSKLHYPFESSVLKQISAGKKQDCQYIIGEIRRPDRKKRIKAYARQKIGDNIYDFPVLFYAFHIRPLLRRSIFSEFGNLLKTKRYLL